VNPLYIGLLTSPLGKGEVDFSRGNPLFSRFLPASLIPFPVVFVNMHSTAPTCTCAYMMQDCLITFMLSPNICDNQSYVHVPHVFFL
jgi:hypothetical protein